MIDKFSRGFVNSVYDFNDFTINELLCKLAQKMDEVITQSNESFTYLDWLKGQGLSDEVIKLMIEWKENGTLQTIINEQLFNSLNTKIDENKAELERNINEINSHLDTITQQRLTTITPQMFGCVGDGVTDDTENFQNCINYAIQNKSLITSDRNKTYKLSNELLINGVVNIDLQDSTLLATHSGSVITVNHRGVNTYNGQLKNINIDCNYVAEKGINIVYSQRRYFQNISIKNVKQYGIYLGVLSGNVNKFSYCYIITDPTIASRCTGIYCDTFDQSFSHIDMINMYICIYAGI